MERRTPGARLTARVIVNRIWHHHFGRGIVRTLDNLGQMGDVPTHPELLDWLAVEFMERGWSIKEMHRLLMTSEAYQMVSSDQAILEADRDNHLLWRFRQQQLEAEVLRDTIMTVSGGIDLTVGGLPIFPFVPEDVLKTSEKGSGTISRTGRTCGAGASTSTVAGRSASRSSTPSTFRTRTRRRRPGT